ncbi:MAG: MraY family glycosyltransferase [Rikenellaceae bacterium]
MLIIILLLSLFISAIVVLYFLPKIMLLSLKNRILDRIDNRKIHSTAACRLGGASFFPAIIISTILTSVVFDLLQVGGVSAQFTANSQLIICSTMILYFVGIYDDIVGMRYKEKFIFQFITAVFVVCSGTYISDFNGLFGMGEVSKFIGIPFSIVLIVFITNAVNLIDGIDGLASMLSIMAFTMYSMMFYLNSNYTDCIFCLASLGALSPFFHHNVFGVRKGIASKIFMGDGGALVIGFILSVMAIKLWNSSSLIGEKCDYISDYSWVVAFTMLIIPCFDVVRVVLHRAKARKPLFLPDKCHFHHKLIALGLTPRKSLIVLLITNLIFLTINCVLATQHVTVTLIILFDTALWLAIHIILTHKISKKQK